MMSTIDLNTTLEDSINRAWQSGYESGYSQGYSEGFNHAIKEMEKVNKQVINEWLGRPISMKKGVCNNDSSRRKETV